MNRRHALIALATGLTPLTAGCGFAHYGGAERDQTSFVAPGQSRGTRLFSRLDDAIVMTESGRQWGPR